MKHCADIAALERAAALLQAAASDASVREIGHRLAAWLDGRAGDRLDKALGIGLPGHRSVATLSAIASRDRLIREVAREFFPNLGPSRQADYLAHRLTLYRDGRWRRGDNLASECPTALRGSIYAFAWRILQHRDHPLKARQLRKILAPSLQQRAKHHCQIDQQTSG